MVNSLQGEPTPARCSTFVQHLKSFQRLGGNKFNLECVTFSSLESVAGEASAAAVVSVVQRSVEPAAKAQPSSKVEQLAARHKLDAAREAVDAARAKLARVQRNLSRANAKCATSFNLARTMQMRIKGS